MEDNNSVRHSFHGLLNSGQTNQSHTSQFIPVPETHDQKEDIFESGHPDLFSYESARHVGRSLAIIADGVNDECLSEFTRLVRQFGVIASRRYQRLVSLGRRLFSEEVLNWSRIIITFMFGCRIALSLLNVRKRETFLKVINFLINFITREKVSRWVLRESEQVSVLAGNPYSITRSMVGITMSFFAVSSLAACLMYHFR